MYKQISDQMIIVMNGRERVKYALSAHDTKMELISVMYVCAVCSMLDL